MTKNPNLHSEWLDQMSNEFASSYMQDLRCFLQTEIKQYKIFPPMKEVFNAFLYTSFSNTKVVIIGQDPYHNINQAHGLCFSVREGIKPPPSLINIYKEIYNDIHSSSHPEDIGASLQSPQSISGDLSRWAKQGVFLLNSVLTVRQNLPGSHRNQGWERFTDAAIQKLSNQKQHLVFLLWGSFAHKKADLVDGSQHLILKAAHPSPFSADRGFFGCHHFSQTNQYLRSHGKTPIIW